MSEPLYQFRYQLTEDAYASISWRQCWKIYKRWLGVGLLSLVLAIVLIALTKFTSIDEDVVVHDIAPLILSISAGCVLGAAVGLLYPLKARRLFREQPALSSENVVMVTDSGIFVSSPKGSTNADWQDILQWDAIFNHLILYTNRVTFLAIPMDDMGEPAASFAIQKLAATGLVKPGRRRKRS